MSEIPSAFAAATLAREHLNKALELLNHHQSHSHLGVASDNVLAALAICELIHLRGARAQRSAPV